LVHRDFKPDNVLIGSDGSVKVTDFGIAVAVDWHARASINTENESGEHSVAGTLRYMSPEQVRGLPLDDRSDQFSFCVALYEALTGQHPFGRQDHGQLIRALIAGERQAPPKGHGIPIWVIGALDRGMSQRRRDRWPSMRELLQVLASDPGARRRRWIVAGAVASLGGLAAFVAGQLAAEPEDPCRIGAQAILETWGDAQRQALAEQYNQFPHGAGSLDAVVSALDDWSERWGSAYESLCRSRHERSEGRQEVRVACLNTQRGQVGARVRLLTQADEVLVSEAPQLVSTLPLPTDCTTGPLDVAPPDPSVASEVADIREALAAIEAELSIHTRIHADMNLDDLRARLETLHERTDSSGYLPLAAEVAFIQNYEAAASHDFTRQRELLKQAYELGLRTRHDRLALRAAISMIAADVDEEATPESEHAREQWNDTARSLSARLDFPLVEELIRREAYANRLEGHGRRDRAHTEITETLQLLESSVGLDDALAIKTLSTLASYQADANKLPEALALLDRADAIVEAWLGRDHPHAFRTSRVRANVLSAMGRYDEALDAAKRARRVRETGYGPDDEKVRLAISEIATIQDLLGNHAEARDAYKELLGPHPTAESLRLDDVGVLNSLCFVHYKLGEYAEGIETCGIGRALARRLWPNGSVIDAILLNNLALIARAQGKPEEGLASDREALKICRSLDPVPVRAMVYSWIGIGESLLALDRPTEALEPLSLALDARKKGLPNSPEHGEAECLVARARAAGGPEQWPWARSLARDGLARLEAGGDGWRRQADACRDWLGAHAED